MFLPERGGAVGWLRAISNDAVEKQCFSANFLGGQLIVIVKICSPGIQIIAMIKDGRLADKRYPQHVH